MTDLVKYGLLAGGAYLAAKYFGLLDGVELFHSVGSGTPVNTGGSTTASPQGNDQATLSQDATAVGIANWIAVHYKDVNIASDLKSVDFWNYAYQSVRGTGGGAPEDLFPGVDRNRLYSFSEWWTASKAKGFSGMGVLARVNPYQNPVAGHNFGDNMRPTGMEMYTKRFG